MSPLLPPTGPPVETVLVPNPFEFEAIVIVLDTDKLPPPVRPLTPVIVMLSAAAPSCVLALLAVFPPVPPDSIGMAVVNPEMVPPVIETLLAF